jgi:hypothetical protein
VRSTSSSGARRYFCTEPWIGVLAIEVNQDVTFCPCYLQMKLGNLETQSVEELWNAPALVAIRTAFDAGELPEPCRGQICPPAVGRTSELTEVPGSD